MCCPHCQKKIKELEEALRKERFKNRAKAGDIETYLSGRFVDGRTIERLEARQTREYMLFLQQFIHR